MGVNKDEQFPLRYPRDIPLMLWSQPEEGYDYLCISVKGFRELWHKFDSEKGHRSQTLSSILVAYPYEMEICDAFKVARGIREKIYTEKPNSLSINDLKEIIESFPQKCLVKGF